VFGSGLLVVAFWFTSGYYFVTYLPVLNRLALSQQITIITTVILATVFCLFTLAIFLTSLIYERPGQNP
jgi:hypothetical protein